MAKRMDGREEDRVEREERLRVEDRKSQRQTAQTWCTLRLRIIFLLMLYFATSDSYFGVGDDYLFQLIHHLKPIIASWS